MELRHCPLIHPLEDALHHLRACRRQLRRLDDTSVSSRQGGNERIDGDIQWVIPCSNHQDHSFGLGLDVARGRLQREWGGHLLRRSPLSQIANGVLQILRENSCHRHIGYITYIYTYIYKTLLERLTITPANSRKIEVTGSQIDHVSWESLGTTRRLQ